MGLQAGDVVAVSSASSVAPYCRPVVPLHSRILLRLCPCLVAHLPSDYVFDHLIRVLDFRPVPKPLPDSLLFVVFIHRALMLFLKLYLLDDFQRPQDLLLDGFKLPFFPWRRPERIHSQQPGRLPWLNSGGCELEFRSPHPPWLINRVHLIFDLLNMLVPLLVG